MHYLKTWFCVDLLAIVPVDYCLLVLHVSIIYLLKISYEFRICSCAWSLTVNTHCVQAVMDLDMSLTGLAGLRMMRLIKLIRLLSLLRLFRLSRLMRYIRNWEEARALVQEPCAGCCFL